MRLLFVFRGLSEGKEGLSEGYTAFSEGYMGCFYSEFGL